MNAHTKQQQDKVFETDFIDSQKSDPPFALPLSTPLLQAINGVMSLALCPLVLLVVSQADTRRRFTQNKTVLTVIVKALLLKPVC